MAMQGEKRQDVGTTPRNQMGRAFSYVILGGGVAAGYAALQFIRLGCETAAQAGEFCIISDEAVRLCATLTLCHLLFN